MFKNLEQKADELINSSIERTSKTPTIGVEELVDVLQDFKAYKLSDKPGRKKKLYFTNRVLSTMLDKCVTEVDFYQRADQIKTLVEEYELNSDFGATIPTNINLTMRYKFRNGEIEKAEKYVAEFERKFDETINNRLENFDYYIDASKFYSN